MAEPTIICPNCKNEIKLTESLAAPLIESTRRDYEQRLAQKDLDLAGREKSLRDGQAALSKAKETLETQVSEASADRQAQSRDGETRIMVVCSAFRARKEGYPNLTVKKIPKAVLARCEWGHDDYSLQVQNLPKAPPRPGQQEMALV